MSVAFSPDGRLVANGGGYVLKKDGRPAFGEAAIWNVKTGLLEHALRVPLRAAALKPTAPQERGSGYVSVAFSSDGEGLIGHCFFARSIRWDLRSGLPLWTDDGAFFGENAAPAVTRDGRFVAKSDQDTVRLLDATNGETLRMLMRTNLVGTSEKREVRSSFPIFYQVQLGKPSRTTPAADSR